MRICPTCNTRYTDATLKFCLQDGAELIKGADHPTEVLDADSFSNDATVAVSARDTETDGVPPKPQTVPEYDTGSTETFVREVLPSQAKGGKKGVVVGLVAGALILGVLGAVAAGFWLVPGMVNFESNSKVQEKPIEFDVSLEHISDITSSSTRKAEKGNLYIPENIMDSDIRTAWGEGIRGTGVDEWVKIEFSKKLRLNKWEIKPGYFKNASIWKKNNRVASVQIQFSDGQFRIFDFPDEMKTQEMDLGGVETEFVKVTIKKVYKGSADNEDTLISEVRFAASR